jgi:hypothetical protein
MNSLRMLFQSSFRSLAPRLGRPSSPAQARTMAYCGTIDMPDGTIRYGYTTIIDFSGTSYLVPYTCKCYVDDIDGLLNNLICDIPKEEYNDNKYIMENVVNQHLFRRYSRDFQVQLYPAAKNISPPCYKMI